MGSEMCIRDRQIRVLPQRAIHAPLAALGVFLLCGFLVVHIWKDLSAEVDAWYFHSTPVWLGVMAIATGIYIYEMRKLKQSGTDVKALFAELPPE